MKKMTLPLVAAAVLGLGSLSAAQAATQARLQVRGIIEPPACNVALEGGSVLNWGILMPPACTPTGQPSWRVKALTSKLPVKPARWCW
ncbi:hypothetical protein [Erwinia aphidicola]|uniref:hypothetical protein n=1 Tax=Erwinia aphidicola TaxID=68334 RepID=UPI0030CA62F6